MQVSQHLPCLAIVCTSVQMAGPPCVGGAAHRPNTLSVYRPHTVCLPTKLATSAGFKQALQAGFAALHAANRKGCKKRPTRNGGTHAHPRGPGPAEGLRATLRPHLLSARGSGDQRLEKPARNRGERQSKGVYVYTHSHHAPMTPWRSTLNHALADEPGGQATTPSFPPQAGAPASRVRLSGGARQLRVCLCPLTPVAFELTQTAADSAHCLARSPRNGFHTSCSPGSRTSCSPAGGRPRAHARAGVDEHAPQHLKPWQHGACSEHVCARRARERRAPSTHPAASAPQLAPIVRRARPQPFGVGGGWQATGEGRRGATPTKPATSLTCRHCLLLAACCLLLAPLPLLPCVPHCLHVQTMQPSDHD